jgi:hypothetical protein
LPKFEIDSPDPDELLLDVEPSGGFEEVPGGHPVREDDDDLRLFGLGAAEEAVDHTLVVFRQKVLEDEMFYINNLINKKQIK